MFCDHGGWLLNRCQHLSQVAVGCDETRCLDWMVSVRDSWKFPSLFQELPRYPRRTASKMTTISLNYCQRSRTKNSDWWSWNFLEILGHWLLRLGCYPVGAKISSIACFVQDSPSNNHPWRSRSGFLDIPFVFQHCLAHGVLSMAAKLESLEGTSKWTDHQGMAQRYLSMGLRYREDIRRFRKSPNGVL